MASVGVPIIILIIGVLTLAIYLLKTKNIEKSPKRQKFIAILTSLKQKLMFGIPITAIAACYISICVYANTNSIWTFEFESYKSIIAFAIVFILPIAVIVLMLSTSKIEFEQQAFENKWGGLYKGVDHNKGIPALLISAVFYSRRILLVSLLADGF